MKMKKLSYGYVEAAHYWWRDLSGAFTDNGYAVSNKDKCVFTKRESERVAFCGTTVDDCLVVCTRDDEWMQQHIAMLKSKYQEITIEQGDQLGLIVMQIVMEREQRKVIISQPNN